MEKAKDTSPPKLPVTTDSEFKANNQSCAHDGKKLELKKFFDEQETVTMCSNCHEWLLW